MKISEGSALLDLQSFGWGKPYCWKPRTIDKLVARGWLRDLRQTSDETPRYHPTTALFDALDAMTLPAWFFSKWNTKRLEFEGPRP